MMLFLAKIGTFVLDVLNGFILFFFVNLNGYYIAISLIAFWGLRRYVRRVEVLDNEDLLSWAGPPPVTILAPAYNEEATCVQSVRSLLLLEYPDFEILVVNDGSKDRTLSWLQGAFDLAPSARLPTATLPTATIRKVYHSRTHPNLWVIDKENGGKSDALNAGLNYCRTPIFCAVDADTLLERDALTRIIRPFLENEATIAVGGIVRIANGCVIRSGSVADVRLPSNLLAQFQVPEYLRAFLAGRMGWGAIDATLVISGAFGVFRWSTVIEAGGYATDVVGEDMELVIRLHRHCRDLRIPYRIAFVPDPIAWTEVPESLEHLGRQRDRWHRGLAQSLWRHRRMFLNPRYGRIGLVALPFFAMELLAPVTELMGYLVIPLALIFGQVSWLFILAVFMVAYVFGVASSFAAIALEELSFHRYSRFSDLCRLFILGAVEVVGYRQLLCYWRIRGLVAAFYGVQSWGHIHRKGFA